MLNPWNAGDQLQYLVMMALKSAGRPLEWSDIRGLTEIWKGGKLRKATFQAAFRECVRNGWIREGPLRIVDEKILHVYELNPYTVAPTPFASPFGLSMLMPVLPYANEKLKKWEVKFSPNEPATSQEHIRRPVKYRPDNVVVVERATANLTELLNGKLAKRNVDGE
jgi:hypothetical protein